MALIRIYLDEDSTARRLQRILRAAGCDAVTAGEADMLAKSDREQLEFAARAGRVRFTGNQGDFARLHGEWVAGLGEHAGIVIRTRGLISPEAQGERLLHIVATRSAEEMVNALLFVSRQSG